MSQDVLETVNAWLLREAKDGAGPQDASGGRAMAERMVRELGEFTLTRDQIESAVGGDLADYVIDYLGSAGEEPEEDEGEDR